MPSRWVQPPLPESDAHDRHVRVPDERVPEPRDQRAPLGKGAVIEALMGLRDAKGHFGRCGHGMAGDKTMHRPGVECPDQRCDGVGFRCDPRCADASRALGYMPSK